MNAAQQINQTSGAVEYYTPPHILAAARKALGVEQFDLDPFSSSEANKRVLARNFFTAETDGFKQRWFGSVWMNHPFSAELNPRAIQKLEDEYTFGDVLEACCITYACTSERWFQPLLHRPQCFLHPRTNYYLPDGTVKKGVTKGSVVTYYGDDTLRFRDAFRGLGAVKIPA